MTALPDPDVTPRQHVTGTKFYCSARATHSVSRGSWYFEIKVNIAPYSLFLPCSLLQIVELPDGAALRVGWAQKNANLQAPLGFDKFGYRLKARD